MSSRAPAQPLAFVHIEKAAGTTFIHLLRRNFFLRYADVRPLDPGSNGVFTAHDLAVTLRMNPLITAIGGHAVRPLSDLADKYPKVRYVTIFRDPVQRYLSQYRYAVASLGKTHSFEEFLELGENHNFQTRKIANSDNVEAAIDILNQRFLAVGVVEQLDEFLVLLTRALQPMRFEPRYEVRNIGKHSERPDEILESYREQVTAVNAADMQLYRYVVDTLLPRQIENYGPDFTDDVARQQVGGGLSIGDRMRYYVDGAVRKFYIEPVSGLIRKAAGMTMKGSY